MNTVNWHTPSLVVNDSRGLPVRQVAYLRTVAGTAAQSLITRQHHDVPGRPIEQWDPRLFGTAPKPNLRTHYRLGGEGVQVDSVDGGWRLSLAGVAGEVLQRWDQRGNHWRTTHDEQLRVTAVEENAQPNVERFTYAEGSAESGNNLRGQMIEQVDPSGRLSFDSYSLQGQALRDTRAFADGKTYLSSRTFSPLGAVLDQTDAGGHRQQLRYDIAAQLKQVGLQLASDPALKDILTDAQYNAAGQIIEQLAGNSVISNWTYDPADGRLTRLKAQKNTETPLQDFEYFHDRVGNITRIEDHGFTEVYFTNQHVDGHRSFTYDSLYQLTSASSFEADAPHLHPGLPPVATPIDTGRLYNYVQHYEYDSASNLTLLRHVREGNNHTQITRIAPGSNRGVRWTAGEPEPVFDDLFDAHGNFRSLQRGQPLTWNSRDQLAVARLVERSGGPHDEETYVYSQGARVSKRLVTQASSTSHVRQVRYLSGLEIRTLDNSEELHVITLPGNVRCLHWVSGQPAGIEKDQLRYGLDDHLGSSTLELDRNGALISREIYYPFGGTAWWAATSQVQADYKTIRYSGKEMDVSGLYYYGARYYAPWLQRWVSVDPGGTVDGLNLYGFVGNNPLRFFDDNGQNRTETAYKQQIDDYARTLSGINQQAVTFIAQLNGLFVDEPKPVSDSAWQAFKDLWTRDTFKPNAVTKGMLANTANLAFTTAIEFNAGLQLTGVTGSVVHSELGDVNNIVGGNIAASTAEGLHTQQARPALIRPIVPRTSTMNVAAIQEGLNITSDDSIDTSPYAFSTIALGKVIGAYVGGVGQMMEGFLLAAEANEALSGMTPMKIAKFNALLDDWESYIDTELPKAQAGFDALKTNVVNPADIVPNPYAIAQSPERYQRIHRQPLERLTHEVKARIGRSRELVGRLDARRNIDSRFK
ncbi:RHS repeat-associated core domain-containing protein [Pseudomonas sp. NPDC087342]|uniref:RHS repeat-associated core domain-containing protein n=1 Tax=Pseudomonas sp. NPDC087342 TaxID=3364437 RepID=UPI0038238364